MIGPSAAAPADRSAGTAATTHRAVRASLDQHRAWRHIPLPERRARVAAALDALTEHRELLALLLVREIGKPWRRAQADVDRAIDGVRWYVDGIEPCSKASALSPARFPTSPAGTTRCPCSSTPCSSRPSPSRGDRDQLFGGFGASWRGAFVGANCWCGP